MALTATKIDAYSIEVTDIPVAAPVKTKYEYDFLVKQRAAITKQRDEMIVAKTAELAKVDALLAECAKLGVVAKPVEEPAKVL